VDSQVNKGNGITALAKVTNLLRTIRSRYELTFIYLFIYLFIHLFIMPAQMALSDDAV